MFFYTSFVKDLKESNVTDLEQIKWIFDGAKSPDNFTGKLTNAVENLPTTGGLPLTPEIASKFGFQTVTALENEILERFDDLFILVD